MTRPPIMDERLPVLAVAGAVLAVNASADPQLRDALDALPAGWDALSLKDDILHAVDGRAPRPSDASDLTDAYLRAYDLLVNLGVHGRAF